MLRSWHLTASASALPKGVSVVFSLSHLAKRYPGRILFTLLLVIVESLLGILFPLFIGWAVNGLVSKQFDGVMYLAVLGIASLVIGAARRFYDTRIYSSIYTDITSKLVFSGREKGLSVSKLTARSDLLTELVEFFEQSVPEIVFSLVGVVGILIVILSLNMQVFLVCLALLLVMSIVYWLTGNKQYLYHQRFNHVLEGRVDTLTNGTVSGVRAHFTNLMRWNIKLSDMETFNFSIIWLGAIGLFVAAPLLIVGASDVTPEVGTILAILIYVFDYSERVVGLPIYIQQLIRLREISNRLNNASTA